MQRNGAQMGTVYHYTSPEAALSIIRDRKLRCTDCEYLNDASELAYCYQLYDQAWVDVQHELGIPEAEINRQITRYANPYVCESAASETLGASISARYYVLCTSTCGDDVVLWENYANASGVPGYALGFDADALASSLEDAAQQSVSDGFSIEVLSGPVCYDQEKQLSSIKSLVRDYFHALHESSSPSAHPIDRVVREEIARSNHWAKVSSFSPFMKSYSFSGEREYRFVLKIAGLGEQMTSEDSHYLDFAGRHEKARYADGDSVRRADCPTACDQDKSAALCFRSGRCGAMTPYIKLDLSSVLDAALVSVRIAPSAERELSVRGMERLLAYSGLKNVSVECSSTRLRF